jgi:inhibitor of cysteine peptidase
MTLLMKSKITLLLTVLTVLLSACSLNSPSSGSQTIIGLAMIESIEIMILESFPVQVHVRIKGILGDSCTTLHQITQTRVENTFTITVTTTRPAEAVCADIITRFEKGIALDVYGLPSGTYIVDVNSVCDTFTLDVDNVIQ